MKNLKLKIISAVMAVALAFGIGFAPVVANAEETVETPVESTETVETPENTDDTATDEETPEVVSYYAQTAENKGVRFDFLDSANVQCVMFLDGVEVATVNATYKKVEDVVDIYTMGDYLGSFRLNADGTATELYQYEYDSEEAPKTEENGEITSDTMPADEEVKDITLPVICGVTGLAGVALLFLLLKGKLKKISKAFDCIVSWFTKKKEEVTTEEIDLKKIEQAFADAVNSNEKVKTLLEQAYARNTEEYDLLCRTIKETVETATDMVGEMKSFYEKRAEMLTMQYEQIKTILIKMVTGSSELVRHGVADEVVKLIEKDVAMEGV